MQHVNIIAGSYRNNPVNNTVFPLVKPFKMGAKGGYVTVDASGIIEGYGIVRINVKEGDFEIYGNAVIDNRVEESAGLIEETDDQIIERIGNRFAILHEMSSAAMAGDIRAMIVVGPPGVGKSYGVEAELRGASTGLKVTRNRDYSYEFIKGAMSSLGLYTKLYANKDPGQVVVFDDCDGVLFDDLSLNILKAALDSSKHRMISWNTNSRILIDEGIPNQFEFKGSVIFITNVKFTNIKSPKLKDHLDALLSRCHYLDLAIDTTREKLLRIKQIALTGQLFPDYGLENHEEEEIIDFMIENASRLREISLRTAIKLADLRKMSESRWKIIAQTTCMK